MRIDIGANLVDRAVAFVNPAAGERRLLARTRMAATSMLTGSGGFRGAQPDRTKRRSWFARARSANADILPGSDRLRAEQRDAAMNQPIATAAINRKTTFVIGTGLMVIPAVDGTKLGLSPEDQADWELRLATDFDSYMASKDADAERKSTGYGLQSVAARGTYTSGDVLALRVMPDDQPGRRMLTAWKLIEADRLRNPPHVADGAVDPRTGNVIAGGVEVDAMGAPVAYWILKQHPGDLVLRSIAHIMPERIEAWDRDLALPRVVHVCHRIRPEQVRGVGMLATVLEPLKMVSDLADAELFAAVMSAMIAIVYKSPGATPLPEPDFGDEDGGDGATGHGGGSPLDAAPPQYRIESGSVLEIDSDAEVEIKSPGRPNSAFAPFFKAIVEQIGAAIDVPAGVLMLLFNSSYTASKAEIEALYLTVRSERSWFGGDMGYPTYECFVAEKVARGDYAMPGFFADLETRAAWLGCDWRGDGKISLNPAQEANGYKIRQDNGWQTGEEITAELTGGNYRENIRKRGREHRQWVDEGLPVAVSPGTPAGNVDEPAKPEKKDDDE
ncbi:phage portal protein, lambda family [Sphingomonas dokdonensis]|uniref:Phage portal protein, lambda family n=2 Tax=Sphingomonas dokdonensis TaxID=344880 RepID=A0A245ZHJ4_9SPHN|nr:phage portal protein, lambda family [Sphingomonas dokdonensis]